jgi:rSAM/selenodomain-associated transferase 2
MAAARPLADAVVRAPAGRASQMNAGAAVAKGEVLLFLHADTELPEAADTLILQGLQRTGALWGRFDVRLSGAHAMLRMVERMMNWRSRVTGICTGDQAIFVTRQAFARAGGFPRQQLMEDIAFSRSMKRLGPPLCLRERVVTSSRRWEENGVLGTILLMWRLRLMYFLGADPGELARIYERGRT